MTGIIPNSTAPVNLTHDQICRAHIGALRNLDGLGGTILPPQGSGNPSRDERQNESSAGASDEPAPEPAIVQPPTTPRPVSDESRPDEGTLTLILTLLLLRASGADREASPRAGVIEDYRTTAAAKYSEIYLPTCWV